MQISISELLKTVACLNVKNYINMSGYIWIYLFHEAYIVKSDVTTGVIFLLFYVFKCLPANEYRSQGKALFEDYRLNPRQ